MWQEGVVLKDHMGESGGDVAVQYLASARAHRNLHMRQKYIELNTHTPTNEYK